jgi:Fe-S-cluster containining protein
MSAAVHLPVVGDVMAICGPCGGQCCKSWPGIPHPDDHGAPDVDAMRTNLRVLLATGRWVIDFDSLPWLDRDDPSAWYPRPAMVGEEGTQPPTHLGFATAAPCTFLVGGRCAIHETKPRGCRELVVVAPGKCRAPVGKVDAVDAWEPYQELLLALREEFL